MICVSCCVSFVFLLFVFVLLFDVFVDCDSSYFVCFVLFVCLFVFLCVFVLLVVFVDFCCCFFGVNFVWS